MELFLYCNRVENKGYESRACEGIDRKEVSLDSACKGCEIAYKVKSHDTMHTMKRHE